MKYDLNKLNDTEFEYLIQSLSKAILGNGAISFGDGADGGREATFEGKAPYPSIKESWNGYWVIQAKFKSVLSNEDAKDFYWVKKELLKELNKYSTRISQVKKPDIFLFFTNVILTPVANIGGRDKASELEKHCQDKYNIKHIKIISSDDIQDFLNSNRNIAITFAPFILPGDILKKLLELLDSNKKRSQRINEIVFRFLEIEFIEDIQSKLEHAGKLTSTKVNLEKVFIDLNIKLANGTIINDKFNQLIINSSNVIQDNTPIKIVLIAGPGYGKSTLTQYLSQIFRAYFIKSFSKTSSYIKEIDQFIEDTSKEIIDSPRWIRLPIRIILKEYASWIKKNSNNNNSISIIDYIIYTINKKCGTSDISHEEFEELITNIPTIFIFDGLDEVPISSNRSEVLVEVNKFTEIILRRINANSIVIATTRPQGYFKEFDVKQYTEVVISDLEKENCEIYLGKLLNILIEKSHEREEKISILKSALENGEISRLMKSPLQASIMAILVISGGEPPRNKFDLFKEYYDIIFKREKQRGIYRILSESPQYINEIHNRLGIYLQSISEDNKNPSAIITQKAFKDLSFSYLLSLDLEENTINSVLQEILDTVTDRLVFISELEDHKIGFTIRSLQEYFAANGYVHNIKDEIIRDRIRKISLNSYWGNTLLFTIGYLSRNKSYLIDYIESLCYELNGSGDDSGFESLVSIPKTGSWLAISILNEAIFRGFNNLENKFSRLLKPLFYVAPSKSHEAFSRLPENIITKWVENFLIESLQNEKALATSWQIAVLLSEKISNFEALFNEYWPKNIDLSIELLRNLFKDGRKSNLLVKILIKSFNELPKYALIELLEIDGYSAKNTYLKTLISSGENLTPIKNNVFEVLFLGALLRDRKFRFIESIGVIFELDLTKHNQNPYNIYNSSEGIIRIEMIKGFFYNIILSKDINTNKVNAILKKAEDLQNKLIVSICKYLIDGNYKNYSLMTSAINLEDSAYRKKILSIINRTSSLLSYFSRNMINIEENIFEHERNKIENIPLKSYTEKEKIDYVKYYFGNSLTLEKTYSKILAYNRFVLSKYNTYESNLFFIRLIEWSFEVFLEDEVIQLSKNKDILEKYYLAYHRMISSQVDNFQISNYYYTSLFFFIDVNKINKLYYYPQTYNIDIHFNYFIYERRNTITEEMFIEIFNKINRLINLQIILQMKPHYELLLHYLFTLKNAKVNFDISTIPFKNIIEYSNVHENEPYKYLILLLDRNLTFDIINKLKNQFTTNSESTREISFLKTVIGILDFIQNSPQADDFLLFFNSILDKKYFALRTDFEEFLTKYISRIPTGAYYEVESYIQIPPA